MEGRLAYEWKEMSDENGSDPDRMYTVGGYSWVVLPRNLEALLKKKKKIKRATKS